MAYAIIQFVEAGVRRATLVRLTNGHPVGPDGVMDPLSLLIEQSAPAMVREGSPGAERMAMVFFTRELEAGRPPRILGADGDWGITTEEVAALRGEGYFYQVDVPPPGDRSPPAILASGVSRGSDGDRNAKSGG